MEEEGLRVEISCFSSSDQMDVKQLVLAGLEERWTVLDPTKNQDLNDIASSYADGKFIVARSEGRLVGCGALVRRENGTGEIVRMSVSRDLRRQRVGSRLLHQLLDEAQALGIKKVVLETTETWQDAIDFYQSQGFRITHYLEGDVYFEYLIAPI
jgi:N-acetylglutamate synthase-like GNAT family acetyltransferase